MKTNIVVETAIGRSDGRVVAWDARLHIMMLVIVSLVPIIRPFHLFRIGRHPCRRRQSVILITTKNGWRIIVAIFNDVVGGVLRTEAIFACWDIRGVLNWLPAALTPGVDGVVCSSSR